MSAAARNSSSGRRRWAPSRHQSPPVQVGILLYGLIRSIPMLEHTLPALRKHVLLTAGLPTLVFSHCYCFAPECELLTATRMISNLKANSTTHTTSRIALANHTKTRIAVLTLASESVQRALPLGEIPQQCTGRAIRASFESYCRGLHSLRIALASALAFYPPPTMLAAVRIDTMFVAPLVLVRTVDPRLHGWGSEPHEEGVVYLPDFQNYKQVNDRFFVAETRTATRFIHSRWEELVSQRHASLPPWEDARSMKDAQSVLPRVGAGKQKDAQSAPNCLFAEPLACWAATQLRLTLRRAVSAKFVRVRADLYVPKVDNATVLREQKLSSWMWGHQQLCPALLGKRNTHKRGLFVVDARSLPNPSGGPEALVQLTLALVSVVGRERVRIVLSDRGMHKFFTSEYPHIQHVSTTKRELLRAGDVHIVPELPGECNATGLLPCGVHLVVYRLASDTSIFRWGAAFHAERPFWAGRLPPTTILREGCGLASHNWYLTEHGLNASSGPRPQLVRPYVTPTTSRFCLDHDISSKRRDELVLVDNDTPAIVVGTIQRACANAKCKVVVVRRLRREQVRELTLQARIVIDWCMLGSERMPIEAVLCGAILLTGRCESGQEPRDFPIPQRNVLDTHSQLLEAVPRVLATFEWEQQAYAPMRRLYGAQLGAASMEAEVREAVTVWEAAAKVARGRVHPRECANTQRVRRMGNSSVSRA